MSGSAVNTASRSTSSGVTFWLSRPVTAEEFLQALGRMCCGERDWSSFDILGDLAELPQLLLTRASLESPEMWPGIRLF